MSRKIFSTTIEEEISQEFKVACTIARKNMNDVLEILMWEYIQEQREPKKQP